MIQIFEPTTDFWLANPGYKVPFKDLVNKKDSSKIMWCIALLVSDKSPYKEALEKDRKQLIETDYFKPKWEDYKEEIKLFESLNYSKVKRQLNNWQLKLEERDEFMAQTKYDENTYEMLDKMMASTDKMWKQYLSIMEEVNKEDNEGITRGGEEESASEKGLL
jgi:hypothetical protein